ncbi:hypothetical protein [Enhygromyxa salina]|uniref:Uncharacterized protein n=1 Tax=Enhygromyxa salina TaxID=215803 RepID=A0A2S9YMP6_9BACT|nr:hypothetical protein [Enhygromyxa salina]PRQ06357.1 hypothetical protein ENSA7_39030 [Enhygromyxa salina]
MKHPARRVRVLAGCGLLTLALGLFTTPAAAWDPSTTHQGLLESAVTRSAVHLRWMDASELERGLFTSLRVDPDRLSKDQLRLLQLTMRGAPADIGARPLGGPGACPSADAPPDTQQFCVDQALWEQSALGWLRLGMLAEVTPSARHLHHFVDRAHPEAPRWRDDDLPAAVLRKRQARSNGEPVAGIVTGTNFSGQASSAVAWLEDPSDLLAPAQTYAHLAAASSASTQAERDHHLALGLLGVGALIHVMQDLSVPAHARGDATAFFAPLSPAVGDRGLPLQEFVRVEYGRTELPDLLAQISRSSPPANSDVDPDEPAASGGGDPDDDPDDDSEPDDPDELDDGDAPEAPAPAAEPSPGPGQPPAGEPLATTLLGHMLGEGSYSGIANLAGRHFFSESSVPAPAYLDQTLSPTKAAATVLGDQHWLDPAEVEGATLSPWPAERGYLLTSTGRPLAAFDTDLDGRIRPYLDETCYRDQAAQLLPAAADVTRSLLDLLWPAWPQMQHRGDRVVLSIPDWASAEVQVFVQADDGVRRSIARHALEVGANNVVPLGAGELAAGERVVLVLTATRVDGPPIVIEQLTTSAESIPDPGPAPIVPVPW